MSTEDAIIEHEARYLTGEPAMVLARRVVTLERKLAELELGYESLETKVSLGALFMIKDFSTETVRKTAQNILQELDEIEECQEEKCTTLQT